MVRGTARLPLVGGMRVWVTGSDLQLLRLSSGARWPPPLPSLLRRPLLLRLLRLLLRALLLRAGPGV